METSMNSGPQRTIGEGGTCDFSTSYEYGYVGGERATFDRSFLSPGNRYVHQRLDLSLPAGPGVTCSPAMPPCGAPDVITAYDIEVLDLPRADVQSALAQPTPPLYGADLRPVDGSVFEFKRADGRSFLVGNPCAQDSSCDPIPPGIAQIKQRLLDLDAQQLGAPECESLRSP
jgi:hypothetical protein